jgi:hypothetical protein
MFAQAATKHVLSATEDDVEIGLRLASVKSQIAALEKEETELTSTLCARIGENYGISGVATWANRKGSISWAKAAEAYGVPAGFAEEYRGSGSRVFKLSLKSEEV